MAPRKELTATGLVALIGLVAGGQWDVAMPVALGLTVAVAAAGAWRETRVEAFHRAATRADALTGLPNVAQLREDLAGFIAGRAGSRRRTLLVFDLVGFKRYNNAFGFACGDAMLRRLARRLAGAVGHRGRLYRLRGAQFGVVTDDRDTGALRIAAGDALFETGEGFTIRCAVGAASIPDQAHDASEALKLADQEVQAERATLRSRGADGLPITSLSLSAAHVPPSPYDVGALSRAVGECLGLTGEELDHLERAAALRDVGMISVPDTVVHAAGSLSDDDWAFVGLHTLAGERLLRSNLGMDGVAAVVRSSHERWDGGGYPDGLSGQDIPLASRIVFVCGAFQDMTAQRPYRQALGTEQSLRELERCAGTRFDPAVVAAFVGMFTGRPGADGDTVGFGIA